MLRKIQISILALFAVLAFWSLATGRVPLFLLIVCILGAFFYLCPQILKRVKKSQAEEVFGNNGGGNEPPPLPTSVQPLVDSAFPPPLPQETAFRSSGGISVSISMGGIGYGDYEDDDFVDEPAEWIPFDRPLDFKRYVLPGGFYFLANKGGWGAESSAVARDAQVGKPLLPSVFTASYYPSYSQILPDERATYLNWLQNFGRGQHQPDIARGYLFLYFYGLERRFLCEGDSDPRIFSTVKTMLEIYGPYHQGRTIITYFSDFLYFSAYQLGHECFSREQPKILNLHGDKMSEDSMSLVLAHLYERQRPLNWEMAYRLAARHDNSRRSVVTKRSGEKFHLLFRKKYEALYPEGVALKTAKRSKVVRYRAANSSLPYRGGGEDRRTLTVPNVLGIRSQFKKLPVIWNECIDDLSGYSRAMRSVLENHDSSIDERLKAYLALPESLQHRDEHPLRSEFESVLDAAEPLEDGVKIVPCSVLANLSGVSERPTLTATQSRQVADLVASLGYSCSPNPHHSGLSLRWDQELALAECTGEQEKPADNLIGVLRLLYLTVIVSAADGDLSEDELQHFHQQLNEMSFSTQQNAEIHNTLIVLSRNPQVALRSLNKISKGVHEQHREQVLHLLVTVAAEDDLITSDELKILKRVSKAMGLPEEVLDNQLEEVTSFHTVQIQKKGGKRKGEPIPKVEKKPTEAFSLDHDKIASISAETETVVEMLSQVLSEDEVEQDVEVGSAKSTPEDTAKVPDWISDLNPIYQLPLLELVNHPDATGDVLKEIAGKHHLMPNSLVDEVNEWSDEALDDFLLEYDSNENLTIYRELLPESRAA